MADGLKPWVLCVGKDGLGVVCGLATKEDAYSDQPELREVRMLVYWDRATRGVLGACSIGPQAGCRVTPAIPTLKIKDEIKEVLEVTPEAMERWRSEPWG